MKRNIKSLPLNLLKLDQENVRFGNDIAQSQREAIELMMSDPEDAKKILKLAEHIAINGLNPAELQLVCPHEDGNYIVLEGNRRLTALKLLQRPDLCPVEKLVREFIKAQSNILEDFPSEIECSVVANREEGDKWVELTHTGQNAGVGRVNWDSDIRDERRARQTGIESVGRQIRNLIKSNPNIFSESAKNGISRIHVTTLSRLFASQPAQQAFQLIVSRKILTPAVELKYIAPSVEYAIKLFIDFDYNVNDVRSDEDRRKFIALIPEDIHPLKLKELDSEAIPSGVSSTPDSESPHAATDGAENQANEGTASDKDEGPGIRSKPSHKARKYLLPWPLKITNTRINEIFRELRSALVVDTTPNAVAVAFRVFLEVSCDDFTDKQSAAGTAIFRSDNRAPLKTGHAEKLSTKIQSVAKHLESQGKLDKAASKTICKRASSIDSVGSVDHFNLFVHSSAAAPIPSELKDIAEEYRPMLEAIWR